MNTVVASRQAVCIMSKTKKFSGIWSYQLTYFPADDNDEDELYKFSREEIMEYLNSAKVTCVNGEVNEKKPQNWMS